MNVSEKQTDLERDLRRALRPRDPGPQFTAQVSARLARRPRANRRQLIVRWAPVALAASVLAALLIIRSDEQALDAQRGLEARAQTLQALRIASENLASARRMALGD